MAIVYHNRQLRRNANFTCSTLRQVYNADMTTNYRGAALETKWMSAGNLRAGMVLVGQGGALREVVSVRELPVNFRGSRSYSVDTTTGTSRMASGYRAEVLVVGGK